MTAVPLPRPDLRSSPGSLLFPLLLLIVGSLLLAGCAGQHEAEPSHTDATQTAVRVRANADVGLNADSAWAGAANESGTVGIDVEQPFRIRFELEHAPAADAPRRYELQVRRNGGTWRDVAARDFPYPGGATPRVSIVSTPAYETGDETTDLLSGTDAPYGGGTGIHRSATSPTFVRDGEAEGRVQTEWTWPIVLRRYADGGLTTEDGDTFSFRMVNTAGIPVSANAHPTVTASVPPRLLAGTFPETPGRLGPWEASNGDLYFLMEPAETYNVLMAVRSADGGATWAEVDGDNRPATGDLEGFASAQHGGTLHLLHQIDKAVLYHAFRTSDHADAPDTWAVRDDTVDTPGEPPVQVASIAARPDGSLVAVYGTPSALRVVTRSAAGTWGDATVVAPDGPHRLSGPQTVLGSDGVVHLAYTRGDGTVWYRRVQPNGTLTPPQPVSSDVGKNITDVGSVLPLVHLPAADTVVVLYRRTDGTLWARRIAADGTMSSPTQVTDRAVVQSTVDSDQTGADAIAANGAVHVLFIGEDRGHIYHTKSTGPGQWSAPTPVVEGVTAQWVRGRPLHRGAETPSVYGFVYDAGSNGGSGRNWYAERPLDAQ